MPSNKRLAIAFCFAFCVASLASCSLVNFFPNVDYLTPKKPAYRVLPSDTFFDIADKYGVTVEALIAMNIGEHPELSQNPSRLKAGMTLVVPDPEPGLETRVAQTAQAPVERIDILRVKELIHFQINQERQKLSARLLERDARLDRIAAARSSDMILRNYFSHEDPRGAQEPFLRYLQAMKFPYRYAGENIAEIKNLAQWAPKPLDVATRYNSSDLAGEFVRGWIDSIEHRAIITNVNYARTGIALAVGEDGRRIVATQVFSD